MRNYGIKTTSRTESSHHELKVYLLNRFADLHRLQEKIKMMLHQRRQTYYLTFENERSRRRTQWDKHECLRPLIGKVSRLALDKVYHQMLLAKEELACRKGTYTPVRAVSLVPLRPLMLNTRLNKAEATVTHMALSRASHEAVAEALERHGRRLNQHLKALAANFRIYNNRSRCIMNNSNSRHHSRHHSRIL